MSGYDDKQLINLIQLDLDRLKMSASIASRIHLHAKEFLTAPKHVIDRLSNRIELELKKFDQAHPAHQTKEVQMCVIKLISKTQHILELECRDEKGMTLADEAEKKLWLIYGLLWHSLEKAGQCANFQACIYAIFDGIALDKTQSLKRYRTFQAEYYSQHDMSESELISDLNKYYQSTCKDIKSTLLELNAEYERHPSKELERLMDSAKLIWRIIDKKTQTAMQKNGLEFDYKLHTHILKKTNELLQYPQDEKLKAYYQKLIRYTDDRVNSTCKILTGAMCLFLSAAAMVTTLILKFTGFAMTGMTLPALLCSASLATGGVTLINKGREKALYSACHQFSKGVGQLQSFSFWNSRNRMCAEKIDQHKKTQHHPVEFCFIKAIQK